MILAPAAFKDMINRALYRQAQLDEDEFDKILVQDEYDLSEVSISFVKDLLNNNKPENCRFVSYGSNDDDSSSCGLIIQRHLTEEEKQKEVEHCKSNLGYAKHHLLKWMENPEHKDMILVYLEHYNIKIKEVN
ncbi:hypothetical protein [Enterococcus sp.]|uniref:hypothetical protein n=1 Tax=Enterococcus sp. TaxID=35783 RepID=UPI001B546059|nr:hypothetical protein [Enterococcus sp.]MBP8751218.1 hypothetical protein [Enterococcus sp.]